MIRSMICFIKSIFDKDFQFFSMLESHKHIELLLPITQIHYMSSFSHDSSLIALIYFVFLFILWYIWDCIVSANFMGFEVQAYSRVEQKIHPVMKAPYTSGMEELQSKIK